MKDEDKTKKQLIDELEKLRQRVAKLEISQNRLKQTEKSLLAAREYAQSIIDNSHDMIITVNNDRRIVEFNRAAEQNMGFRKEEVLGQHVNVLYEDWEQGDRGSEITRKTGKYIGEVMNKRKDGSVFPCLLSATLLKNDTDEVIGTMGISHDITDQKLAEEARIQREKLQGVLEMAGAACHELSQPMQIILSYLEIALLDSSYDQLLHERFEKIYMQVERLAEKAKKIMKITRYETRDYVGGLKIIDIDKSSE